MQFIDGAFAYPQWVGTPVEVKTAKELILGEGGWIIANENLFLAWYLKNLTGKLQDSLNRTPDFELSRLKK